MASAIAADPDLLDVASGARHGPVPNLMLAAVHDLLMQGYGPTLGACYPTISGTGWQRLAEAPALFRDFVLASRDNLAPALASRLVQTNEVRRAALVYLALGWLRNHYAVNAMSLIEVGASAGLLLVPDRYRYKFGSLAINLDTPSALTIETDLRGRPVDVDSRLPEIRDRIGLDLHTLDLADRADRRWLRALIWGDQPERLERLDAAIEIAGTVTLNMIEGDANLTLPGVLRGPDPALPAVVMHSHALNQFPVAAREQFEATLRLASTRRDVYRLSMEGRSGGPVCGLTAYRAGRVIAATDLARYDAHGAWIDWQDAG